MELYLVFALVVPVYIGIIVEIASVDIVGNIGFYDELNLSIYIGNSKCIGLAIFGVSSVSLSSPGSVSI